MLPPDRVELVVGPLDLLQGGFGLPGRNLLHGLAGLGFLRRHPGLLERIGQLGQVGEHPPQALVLVARGAGVLARLVACPVQGRDAQQLEHQTAALGRRRLREGGQVALLGEDRGPEGDVVHPQHRVHVPGRVPCSLSHLGAVGVGLGPHRGAGPGDGPAHHVEVALVLELHLGHAVPVDAGRAHLLLVGPGPAPEGEQHRLQQRALARAVHSVDPNQTGRDLQVQGVLVDPVVAQMEAGQPHSAPSTA